MLDFFRSEKPEEPGEGERGARVAVSAALQVLQAAGVRGRADALRQDTHAHAAHAQLEPQVHGESGVCQDRQQLRQCARGGVHQEERLDKKQKKTRRPNQAI